MDGREEWRRRARQEGLDGGDQPEREQHQSQTRSAAVKRVNPYRDLSIYTVKSVRRVIFATF